MAFVVSSPTGASGQTALAPLYVAPSLAPLPQVPELRLHWPVQPLGVSFSQGELKGFAADLQLYRLEALWLESPRVQLLSAASTERAFELDCRLTCQPVVNRAVELEARLKLPGLGESVPSTYVSLRSSAFSSSMNAQPSGLIRANFGGFLNF